MHVVLTIGLRQKGSPESKQLNGEEEVGQAPYPTSPRYALARAARGLVAAPV